MRDPAREEERGADTWIGHRIRLATEVEIVPHMIDGHDHDHETAKHVDAGEPVGASVSLSQTVFEEMCSRHAGDFRLANWHQGRSSISGPPLRA